jgi:hypothetical protein
MTGRARAAIQTPSRLLGSIIGAGIFVILGAAAAWPVRHSCRFIAAAVPLTGLSTAELASYTSERRRIRLRARDPLERARLSSARSALSNVVGGATVAVGFGLSDVLSGSFRPGSACRSRLSRHDPGGAKGRKVQQRLVCSNRHLSSSPRQLAPFRAGTSTFCVRLSQGLGGQRRSSSPVRVRPGRHRRRRDRVARKNVHGRPISSSRRRLLVVAVAAVGRGSRSGGRVAAADALGSGPGNGARLVAGAWPPRDQWRRPLGVCAGRSWPQQGSGPSVGRPGALHSAI